MSQNSAHRLSWTVLGYWLFWPAIYFATYKTLRTRVLVISGDQILVVKGWINDGRWSLPGGGLKKSELPGQGAVRELREETSLKLLLADLRDLGPLSTAYNGFRYTTHYFSARVTSLPSTKPNLEIRKITWLDTKSINPNNSTPDVLAALKISRP